MSQECPFLLHETLVQTNQSDRHGFNVLPSGIISFYSGNVINIYKNTGKHIEPWIGTTFGLTNDISCINWCKGMNSDSSTPLYLLVADITGTILFIDVSTNQIIIAYKLNSGYAVSILWHQTSINHFYCATSTGEVIFFEIYQEKSLFNIIWNLHVDFQVQYFEISPHNGRELFIASSDGHFSLIYISNNSPPTLSMAISVGMPILGAKFYPFIDNAIIFVTQNMVFLYILNKNTWVPIYYKQLHQDPIINAYFPNPYNEKSVLIVYHNRCEYYHSDKSEKCSPQVLTYLTPFDAKKSYLLGSAFEHDKFYVFGAGHTIQVFELHKKKFFCTQISRTVSDDLCDYSYYDGSIVYGTHSGYILASTDLAINKCFRFHGSLFHRIEWLSKSSCIISLSVQEHQKILFIDFTTSTIKPLLTPNMEMMSTVNKTPIISISPSKNRIVINIDMTVFLFFIYEENSIPVLIKKYFTNTNSVGSFSNDNEFWIFSISGQAKRIAINLQLKEKVYVSRFSTIGKPIKSQPTSCCVLDESFCVGFENGLFIVYNWYGEPQEEFPLNDILTIIPSFNSSFCYITSKASNIYKFSMEKLIENTEMPFSNLKFITNSIVLVYSNKQRSLHVVSDHLLETQCLHKETNFLDIIPKEKCSIKYLIERLINHRFYFISDILYCIDNQRYSSNSFCLNFDEERMQRYIGSLLFLYSRENGKNELKTERFRLSLMHHDHQGAYDILMSTSIDSPTYALDVVKASFIDSNVSSYLAPSIAAMIAGGKTQDAIDLLLLSHQFTQAARQFISELDYASAVYIAKTLMNQSELASTVDILIKSSLADNKFKSVASMMIACRMFEKAEKLLEKYNFFFPAAIIRCLKEVDNHNIYFDPADFTFIEQE